MASLITVSGQVATFVVSMMSGMLLFSLIDSRVLKTQ